MSIWFKLGIILAILGLVSSLTYYVDANGYARGKGEAEETCKDVTVPEALKDYQAEEAKINKPTEDADAGALQDCKRDNAVYQSSIDRMRRQIVATPCAPTGDLASAYKERTLGVLPGDRDELDSFAQRCLARSREFLRCRDYSLKRHEAFTK